MSDVNFHVFRYTLTPDSGVFVRRRQRRLADYGRER